MRFLVTPVIAAALLSTMGCSSEDVSSKNIKTGGFAATYEAKSEDGNTTRARAEFRVGGDESNTHIILDGGDAIQVTGGGETKALAAEDEGVYVANFGTAAAGTEFQFSLIRPDDDDAPDSKGVMPGPFSITDVPSNSPSRATDDIVIKWDNSGSGAAMTADVSGSCIFDKDDLDIPGDTGEYTIKAGTLDSTGGDKPETCDLKVVLWRTAGGSVDAKLDNESTVRMRQVRSATFTSAP